MSGDPEPGAGEPSRQRKIISTVIVVLFVVSITVLIRWMNQPPPPPDIPVDPNRPVQQVPASK